MDIPPIVVISAPSAGGKTETAKRVIQKRPQLTQLVTSTTRPPRPSEVDGVHYNFYSTEKFNEKVAKGDFIETVTYNENLYGSEWAALLKVWQKGKVPLLTITLGGMADIRMKYPQTLPIFLQPEDPLVLEGRLRTREGMKPETIPGRLQDAETEMRFAHKNCRFIVVSKDGEFELVVLDVIDIIDGYLRREIFIPFFEQARAIQEQAGALNNPA